MPVDTSLLSRHYIDFVYIPSGLLLFGTLLVKREWLPYSVLVALCLGAYTIYSTRA